MDNISIANALAPQSQSGNASADMAALLGAGLEGGEGQFGLMLSQQLQLILTQAGLTDGSGGMAGVGQLRASVRGAPELGGGAEAEVVNVLSELLPLDKALPEELSVSPDALIKQALARLDSGAELEETSLHKELQGRLALPESPLAKVTVALEKPEDVADSHGKKLPRELPESGESLLSLPVDPAAMAAMAAAQLASRGERQVPHAEAKNEAAVPLPMERVALTQKDVSANDAAALRASDHATAATGEIAQAPQATPQSFSALLAEKAGGNSGSSQPVALPVLEVPQRIDTPHWGGSVGDKVVWMLGTQTQGAELRLNPPALGPLEVRVSMSDGQATLTFMTPHAPVREAIEAAAPRLREMLGESGISLGSVSVNVGTFAQQQPGSQEQQGNSAGHWATRFDADEDASAPSALASVRYLRDGGMVDLFA